MRRIVSLLPLLWAAAAGAAVSGLPQLGDHVFVPVMDLREPFLTTHVQTTVGLGRAVDATVPVFEPGDDVIIGSAQADILLAGIGFAYQHGVKDWLAVRLSLGTTGRLGTSTHTLLAEGLTAALGYDVGWLARIHESRRVLVSGSVDLGNRSGTFLNLLDWAINDLSLVRNRSSLRGGGGLHAAWGMSRRFGLLGAAKATYGESFDGKGTSDWDGDVRLALSYDAKIDIGVPLGLALTVGRYSDEDSTGDRVAISMWSLRFALQSRDDFTFGLDIARAYTKLGVNGSDTQFNQMAIDMRYYF